MFRGHNNIMYISIQKRDLTKMFAMSSDLADTKNNEKTCAGELKNNTEEDLNGIFNDFNSDKGDLLSENEREGDIWSQTGQLHVIMTIRRPSPRKGLKSIRQQVVQQMRQRDQMPLTNPLLTIMVMVLRGALNGNIIILRIPITLKATNFSETTL